MNNARPYSQKPNPSRPASGPAPEASPGKRYRVCVPVAREGQDTFWSRVGTAFVNAGKDGKPPSISVRLTSHPMGDTLMLFDDADDRGGAADG